mgnify:CR=1 FL=1
MEETIRLNPSGGHPILSDLRDYRANRPLDLLVSNPPYIPQADLTGLQAGVRREPRQALDGGPAVLAFYRLTPRLYSGPLKHAGRLLPAVGTGPAADVAAILPPTRI